MPVPPHDESMNNAMDIPFDDLTVGATEEVMGSYEATQQNDLTVGMPSDGQPNNNEMNEPQVMSPVSVDFSGENIIQDIESVIHMDPHSLPVKKLRAIIPKLKMVTYLSAEEWQGKEKVKFLWENRPYDWPQGVPHADPNNGVKLPGSGTKIQKPKKDDLVAMFIHLQERYRKMTGAQPVEEDKAELVLQQDFKLEISPGELENSGVPVQPQDESHRPLMLDQSEDQLHQLVDDLMSKLTQVEEILKIKKPSWSQDLVDISRVIFKNPEDSRRVLPSEKWRFTNACCEVKAFMEKILMGVPFTEEEFKHQCEELTKKYAPSHNVLVKTELESPTSCGSAPFGGQAQEGMVYTVLESTNFPLSPCKETKPSEFTGQDEHLPMLKPNFGTALKDFNDLGIEWLTSPDQKKETKLLSQFPNFQPREVFPPDEENTYQLPEKLYASQGNPGKRLKVDSSMNLSEALPPPSDDDADDDRLRHKKPIESPDHRENPENVNFDWGSEIFNSDSGGDKWLNTFGSHGEVTGSPNDSQQTDVLDMVLDMREEYSTIDGTTLSLTYADYGSLPGRILPNPTEENGALYAAQNLSPTGGATGPSPESNQAIPLSVDAYNCDQDMDVDG